MLRGLVEEAGTDPETGAMLYRTTGYFLERLGLAALAELPELAPFLPDEIDDDSMDGKRAMRTSGRDRVARPGLGRRDFDEDFGPEDRATRSSTCRAASGCRRCWPPPASAAAGTARS